MRLLASFLAIALACVLGCGGDSSSVMSVWNDGGPGGAAGGSGGALVPTSGGVGGGMGGVVGTGTVAVKGGTRDVATAQCIATSGGTCPWPSESVSCFKTRCASSLVKCYYSDGVAATGGECQAYANCMLQCSCDSGRSACEDTCMQSYWVTDPACSSCMLNLLTCASTNGCIPPGTCTPSSGGTSGANKT
jgi:hypothetical protein